MALIDGISAYWKFDESSGNAADATGNGNTLTNNATATYVTGKINNAAHTTAASSQYFSASDNWNFGETITIAGWWKFDSTPLANNVLVSQYDTSGNQRSWFLVYNTLTLTFWTSANGSSDSSNAVTLTDSTIALDTWYHFGVTRNASDEIKFYLDGSQLGSTQTDGSASLFNSSVDLIVSGRNPSSPGDFVDGAFDEVGVWTTEKTSSEMSELYNSDSGLQYPFTASDSFVPSIMQF